MIASSGRSNTSNQELRAVVLRRKHWLITESDDGDEDFGTPYSLARTQFHSDGCVDASLAYWPVDVDAEVLRKLREDGFNFSTPSVIEFNVHFSSWPPHRDALRSLSQDYPSAAVCVTDADDHDGYLEFQVYALVSYELIRNIQSYVSELMAPYQGVCSGWAVVPSSPSGQ